MGSTDVARGGSTYSPFQDGQTNPGVNTPVKDWTDLFLEGPKKQEFSHCSLSDRPG